MRARPRPVGAGVGFAALVCVVLVTTAAGMHGNAPANEVVRSSASDSLPWIIAGAAAGVGAIAVVFVRRRRRERVS